MRPGVLEHQVPFPRYRGIPAQIKRLPLPPSRSQTFENKTAETQDRKEKRTGNAKKLGQVRAKETHGART